MMRLLLILCCCGFFSQTVLAHGGVGIEDDMCVLKAGPYIMHFTGFQPEQTQSEEFCEDIPNVGSAIIVMDYIDKQLRDMAIDFRIIEDRDDIGNSATVDDLGSDSDIDQSTIYYVPSKQRRAGSFNVEYNFTEPGRFIGIVKVNDIPNGKEYVSVFPFGVGYGKGINAGINPAHMWFTILLVSAAAVMFYTVKQQEKERREKKQAS